MEKKFEFTPKQWVLAKVGDVGKWHLDIYSDEDAEYFYCVSRNYGKRMSQVIPFEGNEHLLSTSDDYVSPPFEPKDGDFITITKGDRKWATIFHLDDGDYSCYAGLALPDGLMFLNEHILKDIDDIVAPSTDDEKKELLNTLHERLYKDWDGDKKEIVEYKWKPQEDELIFRPTIGDAHFSVMEERWCTGTKYLEENYKIGWLFPTEEECQAFCDKLNEAIKNVK